MSRSFLPLTLDQFRALIQQFPFTRKINAVHMHHTWEPDRSQYRGIASIQSMYEFHTRKRGFRDLAQHITIAPDGTIWTGRDWNLPPASATGHNGNALFGPFMFEMIGNFDTGRDKFEDPQRETVLHVVAAVQQRFSLPAETLRFHRQMSDKTCPGSAIDYAEIVSAVRSLHEAGRDAKPAEAGPFGEAHRDDKLTGADRGIVDAAISALTQPLESREAGDQPEAAAELAEAGEEIARDDTARPLFFPSTEDRLAFRPHLINLERGQLGDGGIISTSREDVQRIFREDMERAFSNPSELGMPPRKKGEPFRVLVWAHGGLTNELSALKKVRKDLDFWKRNGVYPVYFIWETGLLQTLGHLLRGLVPGTRGIVADAVTDPLIETAARAAGGVAVWSDMKNNAAAGSAAEGGARFSAVEFASFVNKHPGEVEVHALGHSAGAIFHSFFLPVALEAGIPEIAALYLVAPAIRVDAFKQRLLKLAGGPIRKLPLFTMMREQELADNCALVYRKSLLYLIRFALEPERKAEILGLEESMRRDREVAELFGLGGSGPAKAEAVFSPTRASDGLSASKGASHGFFDDDPETVNSIALRIVGGKSRKDLHPPYPGSARALTEDPWTSPEIEEARRALSGGAEDAAAPALAPERAPAVLTPASSGGGNRRALCIGIDRYPVSPLAGCVADARLWARTFEALGFRVDTLFDAGATYTNIKRGLRDLVRGARPGDVIVFQYAGHGTQVPDADADEKGGDSAGRDEAICPVDLLSGRMLVDDEIGAIVEELRRGVNLTMFIDCCHSGTINRFGFGEPPGGSDGAGERARFLPLTPDLAEAYLAFARSGEPERKSRTRSAIKQTDEVLFSACLSTEVAWESNGQGDFTARATGILSGANPNLTNEEFVRAVVKAFGENPRQTPNMTCAAGARARRLLAPLAAREAPVV